MEQESFGLKKPPGKLNSVWDPVNAELSDVVEYLDKFNDMCVAKVTPDEEKQQRCAAQPCSLREFKEDSKGALSILSESTLLQCTQALQRVNIYWHETLSSNIASAKDTPEDVAAKIASISADAASLVGQIVFSDSDQTAASAVRAKGAQDFSEPESELMEDVDTLQRAISTASWKPSPQ